LTVPAIGPDGTLYIDLLDRSQCDGYTDPNNVPDCGLVAIYPADGHIKWHRADFTTPGFGNENIAVDTEGTVYFAAGEYLRAVNPGDGSTKWEYFGGPQIFFASPMIGADGAIYILHGFPQGVAALR